MKDGLVWKVAYVFMKSARHEKGKKRRQHFSISVKILDLKERMVLKS